MKTVYLVNAPNDESVAAIANDYSFPSLNVLSLGTWLQVHMPEIAVVCRDGGLCGLDFIEKEIKSLNPWLVGIGTLSTSYHASLRIAATAKQVGSWTVLGNDHAAQMAKQIIQNRCDIDFIIAAEYGEVPFEKLLRCLITGDEKLHEVASLTYRLPDGSASGFDYEKDKSELSIVTFPYHADRKTALDIFPIVDRTLYPKFMWDKYLDNYMKTFGHHHLDEAPSGVTTINRARGCPRSKDKIKCKHCDMLLDISFSTPQVFWREVKLANEQVQSEIFYEVCDSFTSFPEYIRSLHKARPKNLGFNPGFIVYGQALDIVRNPDLVGVFKDLNIFKVNIGLESGADETLKHMKGPYDSVEVNLKALQLLKQSGISVYGSFVLGTDAETRKTLHDTVSWIKTIIDGKLIDDVEIQPILPLHNNFYGKKLFTEYIPEGEGDWPLDIDEVSSVYVNKYSGVSYVDCIEGVNEVRAYAKKSDLNYGSGLSKSVNYID